MASLSLASSPLFLILSLLVLLLHSCHAADSDPLQDFCVADLKAQKISVNGFPCKPPSKVKSNDFFFDGLAKEGNTTNIFGFGLTSGSVLEYPGLNTLGVSMNRIDLAPGGSVPPNLHPRANQMVFVLEGIVRFGFVTTANVLYTKVLKVGEIIVVPRGLIRFAYNAGKGKAVYLAIFNSQLPGVVFIPLALFASNPSIPNQVLAKAFQVDEHIVKEMKSKLGS
ncbi:germin-like protein subfamily T member 1 [Tasmannia lanceolata]|uniref:germin-like protein subfamily T member 1 n=1 Tax=Tasmannia lanceolata TaxID=3420 RepID=UPI0040631DD5